VLNTAVRMIRDAQVNAAGAQLADDGAAPA
jgi:hypothetical protein